MWEYIAAHYADDAKEGYTDWLNLFGERGWELIHINNKNQHIFKREKTEQLQRMQTAEPRFFTNPTAY